MLMIRRPGGMLEAFRVELEMFSASTTIGREDSIESSDAAFPTQGAGERAGTVAPCFGVR